MLVWYLVDIDPGFLFHDVSREIRGLSDEGERLFLEFPDKSFLMVE